MSTTATFDLAELIALDLIYGDDLVLPGAPTIECAFCDEEVADFLAMRDPEELALIPAKHARGWCGQMCFENAQESMYS